jgi:transcription elongation GreA/GreB family factor
MSIETYNRPTVALGSRVSIRDIETNERDQYTVTRPGVADIRHHRISTLSPIGRAIYGARPGDIVEVEAPGGVFLVEIEDVEGELDDV